jgi:histone H3/H4
MNQPTLFEQSTQTVEIERVLLFALGEFQSRKKVLTDRELPIDRLRGALKRACEKFETAEISDEVFAESLEKLGAKVTKLQSFVAKHPFRVTVGKDLAEKSFEFYLETLKNE